jgi:hypothetical protein
VIRWTAITATKLLDGQKDIMTVSAYLLHHNIYHVLRVQWRRLFLNVALNDCELPMHCPMVTMIIKVLVLLTAATILLCQVSHASHAREMAVLNNSQ